MIIRYAIGFLMACLMFSVFDAVQAEMKHESGASVKIHHFHRMMNHGLQMVTQGSNLIMIAEMKMSPALDVKTLEHGNNMMNKGKDLILRSVTGPEMINMMRGEHARSPGMDYTHKLGENMLMVMNTLEGMSIGEMESTDAMTMHHQHIMINHALGMAAEGSNLIMIGQMGMGGRDDKFSVTHGNRMLSDAKKLLDDVMDDKAMKELHRKGITPKGNPLMDKTHRLAETAARIIDMLSKMPEAGN